MYPRTDQGKVTSEVAQAQLDDHCASETKIRYSVVIVGHEAPFKWTVHQKRPDKAPSMPANCSGECDSYEGAMLDASSAAHEAEWVRLHAVTKREEHLFDVDVEADLGSQEGSTSNTR